MDNGKYNFQDLSNMIKELNNVDAKIDSLSNEYFNLKRRRGFISKFTEEAKTIHNFFENHSIERITINGSVNVYIESSKFSLKFNLSDNSVYSIQFEFRFERNGNTTGFEFIENGTILSEDILLEKFENMAKYFSEMMKNTENTLNKIEIEAIKDYQTYNSSLLKSSLNGYQKDVDTLQSILDNIRKEVSKC